MLLHFHSFFEANGAVDYQSQKLKSFLEVKRYFESI